MKRFSILSLALLCAVLSMAQTYAATVDSLISNSVAESKIPGAVLCVVHGNQVEYLKAFGYRQVYPDTLPMTADVQFDLASLSKVVGTGMSLMHLIDECAGEDDSKHVDIYTPISAILPWFYFADTIRPLRVVDFLTHTTGLPAYASYQTVLAGAPFASLSWRKNLLLEHIAHSQFPATPEFRYSCLNFISLQYLLEHLTGMSLDRYASKYVFRPLGMTHTCYYPIGRHYLRPLGVPRSSGETIAPTERIAPLDSSAQEPSVIWGKSEDASLLWRRYATRYVADHPCYHAIVHDPLAREINAGVSGNAGLFSTAEDLARLAIWMLNPDSVKGPFSAQTLHLMMSIPSGYESFGRALAWDVSSDYAGCKGSFCSPSAVCHTGYTGTSMVVDPEKKVAIIFLTNRVHPSDSGAVGSLRRAIADAVMSNY